MVEKKDDKPVLGKQRKQPFDIDVIQIDRFAKRLSSVMESRSLKALRSGKSADPEGVAFHKAYDGLVVVATYLGVELDDDYPPNPPPGGSDE